MATPYYTTKAEVEGEFKDITFASGSGNVTQEDVEQFICEYDALINSFVGTRYNVPVSNSIEAFQLLKMYCRILTALRVKGILESVKQATNKEVLQTIKSTMSVTDIMKSLQKISEGEQKLVGVDPLTGGNESYNRSNDIEPVFEKETQQW